jgi:hypothetical protein
MLGCSKNLKRIFWWLSIEIQLTIPKIGILVEEVPTKERFLPKKKRHPNVRVPLKIQKYF